MNARLVLVLVSIVSSGLAAGVLFGWLVSVIPGTRKVGDRTYVETMQSINVEIINPAFIIPFMFTPVLLGAAAIWEYQAGNQRRALTLASAAVSYLVGVIVVTVAGNIPLNDALDAFDLESASDAEVAAERDRYEAPWNRWHTIRTWVSVAAFAAAAATPMLGEGD